MPDYRAVLTLDYTRMRDTNAYNRILKALCEVGWSYAETSALYIECEDLEPITWAMELLARSVSSPGGYLSALNLQVQLVGPPRNPPGVGTTSRAFDNLLRMPLPSER